MNILKAKGNSVDHLASAIAAIDKPNQTEKMLGLMLLKQIKSGDPVNYFLNLLNIIMTQYKSNANQARRASKLILKCLEDDDELSNSEKIEEFVTDDFQNFLFDYIDDPFQENQQVIIQMSAQLVEKFQLDLGKELFTDPLNEKKLLLVKDLITSGCMEMEDSWEWLDSVIVENQFGLGFPIFQEIVNLMNHEEVLQEIFDKIFEKHDLLENLKFYLRLSEIEPLLFQTHLQFFIQKLKELPINLGLQKKTILFIIGNTLQIESKRLSLSEIQIVLNSCQMTLKILLLKHIESTRPIIKQQQIEENEVPAQFLLNEAKSIISFMFGLITKLDSNYQGEEKKPCLQFLVRIVQNMLMRDSDLERRCSILLLQVLSDYLDGNEIKEIQPLMNMLIEFSKYFSDQILILTSLQVLSFIINKSDAALFKLYGNELLKFYGIQYFVNSQDPLIQKQAYFGVTALLRESIAPMEEEDSLKHLGKRLKNTDQRTIITIDEILMGVIGDKVLEILSGSVQQPWILIDLEFLLINLPNSSQANKICMKVMEYHNSRVPNLVAKTAKFHPIEEQAILQFNRVLKQFIEKKAFTTQIVMAYQEFTNNDLLSQYWKKQKVLNITMRLINIQYPLIENIDLKFDVSENDEKKLIKVTKQLKQSLILVKDIFKIKESYQIRVTDLDTFLNILRKVQNHPVQMKQIIVVIARIVPYLLRLFTLQQQEEVLEYLYNFCLTSQNLLKKKKSKVLDAIIQVIVENQNGELDQVLQNKKLGISGILIQQLSGSLKLSDGLYYAQVVKTINKLIKFYPNQSVSLQNVLYNEQIPLALKNDVKNIDIKRAALKLLQNMATYSPSSTTKVISPMMEVFEQFIFSEESFLLRYESIKGLNTLILKRGGLGKSKQLPRVLKCIQDLLHQNYDFLNIQIVLNSQHLMMEILSFIFKLILSDKVQETGLKKEWAEQLTMPNLSNLLSFWIRNLIFFENLEHANYPLIETFIEILLSNDEAVFKTLIGNQNQNLRNVLQLIYNSLYHYCFEEELEEKIGHILLSLQGRLSMVFIFALSDLGVNEKNFINQLIKKHNKRVEEEQQRNENENNQEEEKQEEESKSNEGEFGGEKQQS